MHHHKPIDLNINISKSSKDTNISKKNYLIQIFENYEDSLFTELPLILLLQSLSEDKENFPYRS